MDWSKVREIVGIKQDQAPVDLGGIKADIAALFTETSRNKYRIEEVDIRLSNLELTVKALMGDLKG